MYEGSSFTISFNNNSDQPLSQVCPSPHSNPMITQSQQTIYPSVISCFPQMRPEVASQKLKVESEKSEYMELGVPEEWVGPLKALGFNTIDKLKEVEKPGKRANDLNGYKKKNKLDLPGLNLEIVGEWIKS